MWRLFITLYALLAGYLLVIDFLPYEYVLNFHRDTLLEDQSKDSKSWLQAIDHFTQDASLEEIREVIDEGNRESNMPIVVLSRAEMERQYPQAISQFNEYNQFFLDLDGFEFLYRMNNQPAVLKVGPIDTITRLDDLEYMFEYVAWLLLAVVILFWQVNLWRKLVGLERKVVEFGGGNLSARASEKAGVRIGKLNSVFNGMAEKIGQLLVQNKQLIRAVSHELRAPISRMRCQIDLLDADNTPSQNAIYLADMSGDITELENLVEEILNYSRLEASDSVVSNIRERNVKPVLEELLNTMNREASNITSLACASDVCARFDEMYFRRAVGNLVQNATRYCANIVNVSVAADKKNAMVIIHVDDDGPGIPLDERARVFEPFTRLDQSRTRDTGGYGLGLAIVKQIAQFHGGDVQISTSPLNGARFSLAMPGCSGKKSAN